MTYSRIYIYFCLNNNIYIIITLILLQYNNTNYVVYVLMYIHTVHYIVVQYTPCNEDLSILMCLNIYFI